MITRVKTSRRPVELFGFAFAADLVREGELLDQRHQVGAVALERRAVAEVDLLEGEVPAILSSTVESVSGRKLQRSAQANSPSRRSRLAGWTLAGGIR